jgi:hypothetical protein
MSQKTYTNGYQTNKNIEYKITIDLQGLIRRLVALEEENLILRQQVAEYLFRMPDETYTNVNTTVQEGM